MALHSTYKWFPNELRTLPTAIIAQGAGIGIMVALPLLNWVIVHYSWHWAFGVLGFAGLAWTAAWLVLGREGSLTAAAATDATPTPERMAYGQLLLSPTIIACWCASFGAQWGLSQALSWQGAFLIKGLGFAQGSIGLLGALPAGASVILVIAAGWYSQRLLARGVSSRVARGIFGGACVALGGAALAIMPYLPGIPAKIALTTIGVALPSVIYVIGNAVVSEITPVAQRGALLAIGTAVSTSAGLLAPYVMGSVIETAATPLDGFNTGFMICGVIMLAGGVIGMALIRPEREAMRWASEMPEAASSLEDANAAQRRAREPPNLRAGEGERGRRQYVEVRPASARRDSSRIPWRNRPRRGRGRGPGGRATRRGRRAARPRRARYSGGCRARSCRRTRS